MIGFGSPTGKGDTRDVCMEQWTEEALAMLDMQMVVIVLGEAGKLRGSLLCDQILEVSRDRSE